MSPPPSTWKLFRSISTAKNDNTQYALPATWSELLFYASVTASDNVFYDFHIIKNIGLTT